MPPTIESRSFFLGKHEAINQAVHSELYNMSTS
uniref:Uncharacterized protein n=1 Tax=Arundo donax TaxID=35708 RepID=A0A0A8ZS43_ARUDO